MSQFSEHSWMHLWFLFFRAIDIDKLRVTRISVTGLLFGVIGHYWYLYLDRRLVGHSLTIVIKKTIIDQLIFCPIGITLFFSTLGLLEGSNVKAICAEIRAKGLELVIFDSIIYPPAQFISFRFLPTQFRVLYDCCVAFLVDVYYSHIKFER